MATTLLLLCLLAAAAAAAAAPADQIYTTSGTPFGRSSREPRYDIRFHPVDSPFNPEDGQESMPMTDKEGNNYMCFLPRVEEAKTVTSVIPQNASSMIVESERRIKPKEPDELLDDFLKDECYYRHDGWWTYEFCYNGKVRQIHLDGEKVVQEFVLGIYDPEATAEHIVSASDETSSPPETRFRDASQRYHSHIYTNGTVCDLTNEPRETEVRFVCAESTILISSIKEISSCKYVMIFHAPMLCKHPMFRQENPTLLIHCNNLMPERTDAKDDPQPKLTKISIIPEESEFFAT